VREESIGILTKQSSYSLKNIVVREFASKKFLSMGKRDHKSLALRTLEMLWKTVSYLTNQMKRSEKHR